MHYMGFPPRLDQMRLTTKERRLWLLQKATEIGLLGLHVTDLQVLFWCSILKLEKKKRVFSLERPYFISGQHHPVQLGGLHDVVEKILSTSSYNCYFIFC